MKLAKAIKAQEEEGQKVLVGGCIIGPSDLAGPVNPSKPRDAQLSRRTNAQSLQLIREELKEKRKEFEANVRVMRLTICKDLLQMAPDPDAQREAIKELQNLIKDDPTSPEAKEAAKLLEGIKKKP
jgi:hypothetical protein